MRTWHLLIAFIVLGVSLALKAEPAVEDAARIQQQLNQAQQTLSKQQQQQKKLNQDIAKTQSSLQDASRQLETLTRQQQQSAAELKKLEQHLSRLQAQNQASKAQVQRLLNSQYKNKQPEALVLMLKNSNPNDKGRQMVYLRYLNRANDQVLHGLKQQLQDINAQQQKISQEHARLNRLQQQSAQAAKKLQHQHTAQTKQSNALQQDISKQQAHIAKLKQDEARLNQLLANLSRKQAAKAKTTLKPTAANVNKKPIIAHKTPDKTTGTQAQTKPAVKQGLTSEDLALSAPAEVALSQSHVNRFSQLQGRMSLPASGSITGRFGSARASGGVWKGLFIANSGASVHSVAAGEVVYAAALAGYGSTVIVDHGGGYMTVYAGLSSIAVNAGQSVSARGVLGSSGSLPAGERGLYFEVRYQNRAMNPLSWVG